MTARYAPFIAAAVVMFLVIGLFPRSIFAGAGMTEKTIGLMVATTAASAAGLTAHYVKRWLNEGDRQ